ncbi:hypothetical protein [Streptomyces sp. NPDC002088]|uniref:hypothetical protein n=1 Tax=Streptomyces sp. NPDC002088 TaxID=3154665 RepID=UPI003328A45A
MPTVRTTMQPDKPIEVGDAEYLDLKRQDLLIGDGEQPEPAPQTAAEAPTTTTAPAATKKTGAAGSKEN